MCKGTKFFWTFSLIGIHWGCSDLKLEQEATEILSEDQDSEDVAIIESADGLQFTQNKPDSGIEATVGFSKQGHVSYKGDFKNDQPHGLWTTFFPDGKPRWQGYKKEGINHGKYTMWYENGRKRMEGSYENGQKHGRSISWHPNGARWQHKFYDFGEPKGTWSTWDNQGNLLSKVVHENLLEENASRLIQD